ncbi:pentapeptide repeat-containing protein [Anabaena sphaerica FACHB-251]|uniref:Pentapeptide repeat-containing protein n=1 Tax=Anabaena sphaerica FACHB-251 TaxID=2692883 RepID=A0A926WDJ8_9NOST|nr:pentapeptide repeat-containing protein [Anabaena sphaerica]MBD2292605.1 pentapeptide repeat-containing protein [Anabaena sphaerica FACHB-251]
MANEEHLAILKQGVEVWNSSRLMKSLYSFNEIVTYDLSGSDLSNTKLSGANLSGANLSRTTLCLTNFFVTDFSEADLSLADLSFTNLVSANLSGANLSESNLSFANLAGANLSGANLADANLSGANLASANLSGANLTGANLSCANLNWADLSCANLNWANLNNAQIIETNLHNANLTGACIKNWHINNETKLDDVFCEYVYLDYNKTQRRPTYGKFLPGGFASLYTKIIENTTLILSKALELENTINNQGVQFYSNPKIHIWEKLRFRSETEIKIAEALYRTRVLFLPNSLARLTTPKGRENTEADFLICYNGKWGVLEVDGPFHTAERRVEEQERERIFKKNGIKVVERFDAQRCYNNPDEVVQEFFKMIEIGYS